MSPAYSKRRDAYGGTPSDRCQLPIEIAEAIRARVGTDTSVGIRISYDEFGGEGSITAEMSEEQLETLSANGLFDFFSISDGGYDALHMAVADGDSQLSRLRDDLLCSVGLVVGERDVLEHD